MRRTYWVNENQIAFVYQGKDDDHFKVVIQNTKMRSYLRTYVKNRRFHTFVEAQECLDRVAKYNGWELRSESKL